MLDNQSLLHRCFYRHFFIVAFYRHFFIVTFEQRQYKRASVGFGGDQNRRIAPALLFPDRKDIRNTAARAFTDIDQIEHLHHRTVARIGDTAGTRGGKTDAEITRVGHGDHIFFLDNDKSLPTVVIGVDQTVRQRFAQRPMDRRIIDAVNPVHLKGDFQIKLKLVIDPEIEIEDVSAPISGRRDDPICPPMDVIVFFAIIQEVARVFTDDIRFVPKHQ